MTQAKIIAAAFINDEQMIDINGPVEWTTETTTDIPYEYLGECVGICLTRAWRSGIDPAVTEGFNIRVNFQ